MRSYGALPTEEGQELRRNLTRQSQQKRTVAVGLAAACLVAALALVAWQGAASRTALLGWGNGMQLVERPMVVPVVYEPYLAEHPLSETDRLRVAYGQAQLMHIFSPQMLNQTNGSANGTAPEPAPAAEAPAEVVEEGGDESEGDLEDGENEEVHGVPEFKDESDCPEAEPDCHKVDLGFNVNKWHIGVDFHISSWPWEAIEKAQQHGH